MDNIKALLTTTEGRIGRQQWWIGIAILSAIGLAVGSVLGTFTQELPFIGRAWLLLLLGLVWIWPAYCVGIKRRYDRGSDGTDLKIFLAGGVVLQVFKVLVSGSFSLDDPWSGAVLWLHAANLIWSIFSVYLFVQLGFLEGDKGPNTYGPDPLVETQKPEPS